jgi:hypothetical protein
MQAQHLTVMTQMDLCAGHGAGTVSRPWGRKLLRYWGGGGFWGGGSAAAASSAAAAAGEQHRFYSVVVFFGGVTPLQDMFVVA